MSPNEMEGDLNEWGDMRAMVVRGLSALGYPSGGQEEYSAHTGKPPQPNYFTKAKIQNLEKAISGLQDKYKNILICRYICKMGDREIGRAKICDRGTVPKRLDEGKHLLVISRYWKT